MYTSSGEIVYASWSQLAMYYPATCAVLLRVNLFLSGGEHETSIHTWYLFTCIAPSTWTSMKYFWPHIFAQITKKRCFTLLVLIFYILKYCHCLQCTNKAIYIQNTYYWFNMNHKLAYDLLHLLA